MLVAIYPKFKTLINKNLWMAIYFKFIFNTNLYLFKIYICFKFKIIENISGDLAFKMCLYIEVNIK